MKEIPVTLIVTLIVAGLPGHARAQSVKRPGRFQVGPLYFTPSFEFSAGVDTNVFNSSLRPVPDTLITLSPTVEGVIPVGRRLRLTGSGLLGVHYFGREGSERSTDFAAQGGAELDLRRVSLFAEGGGGQYRQRFSIEIDERVLRQEKWVAAGAKFNLMRKVSITGTASARTHRFEGFLIGDDDLRGSLDRNSFSAVGEARYALTRSTTILTSASGNEDRFLSGAAGIRRARSYRYLGGLEFAERAFLNGKILAGLREFPDTNGQGAPPYRGPALSVSASMPLSRFGRLEGIAERDISYAVALTGAGEGRQRNSFVSTRFTGQIDVSLPFDLIARGFGTYQEAKYLLPYPIGNSFARRVDRASTVGGSLLRRLGDNVRAGITAAWSRRISNFPGQSYGGRRYGVQAEFVPRW